MKRKLLREKYGLREEPCNDCLVTAFCAPCANCQDARELKARGMHSINYNPILFIFLCEILAGPQVGPNRMPIRSQPAVAYRR